MFYSVKQNTTGTCSAYRLRTIINYKTRLTKERYYSYAVIFFFMLLHTGTIYEKFKKRRHAKRTNCISHYDNLRIGFRFSRVSYGSQFGFVPTSDEAPKISNVRAVEIKQQYREKLHTIPCRFSGRNIVKHFFLFSYYYYNVQTFRTHI